MNKDASMHSFRRGQNCCDFDHMTEKGRGIHFFGTRCNVGGATGIVHSRFATARTLGFRLPNRSQAAGWNERDAACI